MQALWHQMQEVDAGRGKQSERTIPRAFSLRLLRSALDALSTSWTTLLVILVHTTFAAECAGSARVGVLEVRGLGHGVWGRRVLERRRGEDIADSFKGSVVGGPALLWELDIELNIEVATVVVAEGWHTLAADHLDSTCSN